MSTLALRLSSPIQAWPAHSRGIKRPTHRAPTYSGLSGLARCALGIGRDETTEPLAGTDVALRIDRAGRSLWDYHSINQMPVPNRRFQREREFVPAIETMKGSPYRPTVLTEREYLSDAVFIVFIESGGSELDRLAEAFRAPHWQVFLGRKSCAPSPDLVLGTFGEAKETLVRSLPTVASKPERDASLDMKMETREVHWLSKSPGDNISRESWPDQPSGPVGDSYQMRPRDLEYVQVPTVPMPQDQRRWVVEHRENVAS